MRTVTRTFATACALAALVIAVCDGKGGQDTKSRQEVSLQPRPANGGPIPDDTTSRSIFDSPTGVFGG